MSVTLFGKPAASSGEYSLAAACNGSTALAEGPQEQHSA
jgi:hypothetical protein